MFHWIFIINLYGSMNFCLLFTYLCRILPYLRCKLVGDQDKDASLHSSTASDVFFSLQNLTSMFKTFSKLAFLLLFCPLAIHSLAHPLIHPIYPPVFPFPSSFYLYSPISVPKQSEERVILAHHQASTFRIHTYTNVPSWLSTCLHQHSASPPPLSPESKCVRWGAGGGCVGFEVEKSRIRLSIIEGAINSCCHV